MYGGCIYNFINQIINISFQVNIMNLLAILVAISTVIYNIWNMRRAFKKDTEIKEKQLQKILDKKADRIWVEDEILHIKTENAMKDESIKDRYEEVKATLDQMDQRMQKNIENLDNKFDGKFDKLFELLLKQSG